MQTLQTPFWQPGSDRNLARRPPGRGDRQGAGVCVGDIHGILMAHVSLNDHINSILAENFYQRGSQTFLNSFSDDVNCRLDGEPVADLSHIHRELTVRL